MELNNGEYYYLNTLTSMADTGRWRQHGSIMEHLHEQRPLFLRK